MPLPQKCHACAEPLDGYVYARVTFDGFTTSALNGVTFLVHARCLMLNVPPLDVDLPPRISDPIAEPAEWEGARA